MRIIISPAKKMKDVPDLLPVRGLPPLLAKTRELLKWLQSLSYEEAKALWKCSDALAKPNYEKIRHMDLTHHLSPALLSYVGIQYQYMAPDVFSRAELLYVQEHVRILSGFYGVLSPLDGVTPYRLEMQAKGAPGEKKNLYDFWGDQIYRSVVSEDETRVILNLASKEYARCVEKYLTPEDTMVTCVFGEWKDGRVVQKGTLDKMARGEMVRFMAEHQIQTPEEIKTFDRLGFRFHLELSSEKVYVFLSEKKLRT